MWIYILALILGLGGIAAIWLYRRLQKNAYFESRDDRAFPAFTAHDRPTTYSTSNESRTLAQSDQSGVSAEAVSEHADDSDMYLANGSTGERECPRCQRTFPASIVVCPFDSSPLEESEPSTAASGDGQSHDEILDRMACSGCGRRYPADTDYCYHDGLPLGHDTREAARDAKVFKACETCGWEGRTEDVACPNGGDELVKVDPSDATAVSPTIPLMFCPKCREFAPPGVAHCPDDGTLLTPMTNVRVTTFPAAGFGPRRKICKHCGTQFSGQADYCSHDGTELLPLN